MNFIAEQKKEVGLASLHQALIKEYRLDVRILPAAIQQAIRLYSEIEQELASRPKPAKNVKVHLSKMTAEERETYDILTVTAEVTFKGMLYKDGLAPHKQKFFFKKKRDLMGAETYYFGYAQGAMLSVPNFLFHAVDLPEEEEYKGDFKASLIANTQIDLYEHLEGIDRELVFKILGYFKQVDKRKFSDIPNSKEKEFFEALKLFSSESDAIEFEVEMGDNLVSVHFEDEGRENEEVFGWMNERTKKGEAIGSIGLVLIDAKKEVEPVSLLLADGNSFTKYNPANLEEVVAQDAEKIYTEFASKLFRLRKNALLVKKNKVAEELLN